MSKYVMLKEVWGEPNGGEGPAEYRTIDVIDTATGQFKVENVPTIYEPGVIYELTDRFAAELAKHDACRPASEAEIALWDLANNGAQHLIG